MLPLHGEDVLAGAMSMMLLCKGIACQLAVMGLAIRCSPVLERGFAHGAREHQDLVARERSAP